MPAPWAAMAPAVAAPTPGSTGRAAGDLTPIVVLVVLALLGAAVTAAWIRVGRSPRAKAPPDRAAAAGRGGGARPVDWRPRIAELVRVQQQLHELDVAGLWEWSLPAVAATEERLAAVEAALGEALDPAYRGFLARADGWDGFLQDTDLFGSDDLLGSGRFASAVERLGDLDAHVLDQAGVARDQLLPIAACAHDLDVFVMTRRNADEPGRVIWFAANEIDRFAGFGEYFASMAEYNRLEVDHFREHGDQIARGLGARRP